MRDVRERAFWRMPRFFFDVIDDKTTTDDIGLDLEDLDAAQREVVRTLPGLARDALPDARSREFAIEVRDDAGRKLLRATLALKVERLG